MFLSEAAEHLQLLNTALLALERDPGDSEQLTQVFRSAHTIKGMAATMGYETITSLAHTLESTLDPYRKQSIPLPRTVVDVVFMAIDALERLLGALSADGPEPPVAEALERLRGLSPPGKVATPPSISAGPVSNPVVAPLVAQPLRRPSPAPIELEEEVEVPEGIGGYPPGPVAPTDTPVSPHADTKGPPLPAPTTAQGMPKPAAKKTGTIRISTDSLERLLNLVEELTINKSRLQQLSAQHELGELSEAMTHVNRLTKDLQDEVLKMRMVPVRYIFDRFPRMVRDLARDIGKQVEFVVEGWEIELDRTVLDEISEPLVHLLRNSVDHGIEFPPVRTAAGKDPIGTIRLTAVRQKSHVEILVQDDGGGIDPGVFRRKAVEKGLMDETRASQLTDAEAVNLVFLPNFSSRDQVTEISGRGVGMDVVKTKVEALGGIVELETHKGEGTLFRLRLPLTMAIITVLLVVVSGQTYGIPVTNVIETLKLPLSAVKTVRGREVLVWREEVVPLLRLPTLFHEKKKDDGVSVLTTVIVERGDRRLALVVDELVGQQEVVIKPLGRMFQSIRGIAGATILGDGRVALVVDVGAVES